VPFLSIHFLWASKESEYKESLIAPRFRTV
jgi:hypothetical protein